MRLYISMVIGIVVGCVGTLFSKSLHFVNHFRITHPMMIYGLPFAGILICLIYNHTNKANKQGTNLIIDAINKNKKIPCSLAPVMFISTLLTHLCGGSAGREGAALQIGGSIGQTIGTKFKSEYLKEATACGMAACFSALFLTPMTAAILALEIAHIGKITTSSLIHTSISSFIAFFIGKLFYLKEEAMLLTIPFHYNFALIFKVLLLSLALALVAILFCKVMHLGHQIFSFKNPYINIIFGSIVIILFNVLVTPRYQGAGMDIIFQTILNSRFETFDFLFKIVLTAITLGCGFKGGEIVPCFFVGTTFGALCATLLGLPVSLGSSLGLCICFGCSTRCVISAMMLGCELFGVSFLPLLLFGMVISFSITRNHTLYQTQFIDEGLKIW